MFNQLTEEITTAWSRITDSRPLSPIFILGTIIAGSEAGFVLPPVRCCLLFLLPQKRERRGERVEEERCEVVDGSFADLGFLRDRRGEISNG